MNEVGGKTLQRLPVAKPAGFRSGILDIKTIPVMENIHDSILFFIDPF
jgi:hypothetical protein